MIYTPAPHHQATMDWFRSRPAAAVWLDMASGKTAATATLMNEMLDQVEVTRWLVVGTPRIAKVVWRDEFAKWDHLNFLGRRHYHITAEDLPVEQVKVQRKNKYGEMETQTILRLINQRQSRRLLLQRPAEVFTIHYDMLPRLAKLFGDEWPFDGVVLDESSMVSEQDTDRFKALRRIRGHVKRFYELTGTPASNGLEKLFTQVFLMDGGRRLGRTLTEFRERFMQPGTVDHRSGRVYKWVPRPGARELIYAAVSDLCLSLDPGDWVDLPEIVYNTITVELPPEARALYDSVERDYIATLQNGAVLEAPTAAVLGNKLMQIANGTVYDVERNVQVIHDAKLDALQELMEVTDGQVLLAYWYQHDRDRIKAKFKKKAVDLADEPEFEEKWNAGQVGMGMIQPASGGHGLNLQGGGNIACWYGPIYNLELYLQFNKRLPRPGQKAKSVTVHHLIAKDTIEEDILAVNLAEKQEEQDALLAAVQRRVDRVTGRAV